MSFPRLPLADSSDTLNTTRKQKHVTTNLYYWTIGRPIHIHEDTERFGIWSTQIFARDNFISGEVEGRKVKDGRRAKHHGSHAKAGKR